MTTNNHFSFIDSKFRNLLLYLALRSENDPRFGATKLNKLLYYIDFAAYRMLGKPATGATYQNLPEGPAPRELLHVQAELLAGGHVSIEERPYFNGVQKRLVAETSPNMEEFSKQEMQLIEEVLAALWSLNATQVSDLSHEKWGWRSTETFDNIPYHTAWFSSDPLTDEQIVEGRKVAERHHEFLG